MNNEAIYNYTFHFNYHTDVWTAIPRGMESHYWNNMFSPGMLRSKNMDTLVEIIARIAKNPGFLDKLEKL